MKPLYVLPVMGLILLVSSQLALADEGEEIRLFVESTIGVNVTGPAEIRLNMGETGGVFLTIVNEGNIRDKIRLSGQLIPQTDWVEFAFICGETPGVCDSIPSSEMHLVDDIQLTPEIREAEVYLEMTGWRKTSTFPPAQKPVMVITGFSLTNRTKQGLANIPITIEDPEAGFGPLASPDMTTATFVVMLLTTIGIAAARKDVLRWD